MSVQKCPCAKLTASQWSVVLYPSTPAPLSSISDNNLYRRRINAISGEEQERERAVEWDYKKINKGAKLDPGNLIIISGHNFDKFLVD